MKPEIVRQLSDQAWVQWWKDKCPGDWTAYMINFILKSQKPRKVADPAARIQELEARLAEAVAERDEARYHADADVCGALDCGSGGPTKSGWRTDCECDEYELRYAAKRGFIERHPERPTWFRFTKAGKEYVNER